MLLFLLSLSVGREEITLKDRKEQRRMGVKNERLTGLEDFWTQDGRLTALFWGERVSRRRRRIIITEATVLWGDYGAVEVHCLLHIDD